MVKIEKLIGPDFNTKPTYGHDDKYIKTKKTYEGNMTTNSYNKKGSKKLPEEKITPKCLSIIILDSILAYEKYHPQTFLEECKICEKKYIKTKNYIDKELKSESDSDSDSGSDSDTNNEE